MTPRQAAEYRDELARRGIALQEREKAIRKATQAAKRIPTRRRKHVIPEPLPPRSQPPRKPTSAEQALADRLIKHVCPDSVIDRQAHALGVARMLLNMGVRPQREPV